MTLQAQFLVSGHIAKLILYLIIIRVANHVTDKSGLPLAHHIWPYDTKAAMVMVKTFRLRLHCGLCARSHSHSKLFCATLIFVCGSGTER